MSSATQSPFVNDSWQTPRNARTLAAYMALRQKEIGERIAQLRQQRGGPPQDVVARGLGVAPRTYQNWEAGDAKPAYRNLERLAEFFGVTEDYILTGNPSGVVRPSESQLDRIEAKVDQVIAWIRARDAAGFEQALTALAPPDATQSGSSAAAGGAPGGAVQR